MSTNSVVAAADFMACFRDSQRHQRSLHDIRNVLEIERLLNLSAPTISDLRELTPRAPDPAQQCDLAGGPDPDKDGHATQ